MSPRVKAVESAGRTIKKQAFSEVRSSEKFGCRTFSRAVMEKVLPRAVYQNLLDAIEGRGEIEAVHADTIAQAMKDWALENGATHYSHWFLPLTGSSAEKHDAFIDWKTSDTVIEKFSGKQLLQGEPDASSFPSGGLRSTYEARGYTGWDPSSPAFLWESGDGITLCIPSVFFSWTGECLDAKIPLLRSDEKINKAVLRLLRLTKTKADVVYSTVGCEQEYFVVDRALYRLRPDLMALGRTVFGAAPPKGQELSDHYFGAVNPRVLKFMCDFEHRALELGIPVKTRHNEVAPAQYEIACVHERASIAIDHNLMLMELMRQVATEHDLVVLLHEKPYARINGSGKHLNWSLATDTGHNLLDPTDAPENSLQFIILMTAILKAVHDHAPLLRASIASAGNDYRLGGHEAPPAILSVYLGEALEVLFSDLESKGSHFSKNCDPFNLGIPVIPKIPKHNTDRNRTSPFAFTGNKFEFRAVGSSANCARPAAVLNAVVADSLNHIMDEIEKVASASPSSGEFAAFAMPVVQKFLRESKSIRYHGDNYSQSWQEEAKKRGLPNLEKSVYALDAVTLPSTVAAYRGILTQEELESRKEIWLESFYKTKQIEARVVLEIFYTQLLPAALRYQRELAETSLALRALEKVAKEKTLVSEEVLQLLTEKLQQAMELAKALDRSHHRALELPIQEQAVAYAEQVHQDCLHLRSVVDAIELLMDDASWPLPKYRELLFVV